MVIGVFGAVAQVALDLPIFFVLDQALLCETTKVRLHLRKMAKRPPFLMPRDHAGRREADALVERWPAGQCLVARNEAQLARAGRRELQCRVRPLDAHLHALGSAAVTKSAVDGRFTRPERG